MKNILLILFTSLFLNVFSQNVNEPSCAISAKDFNALFAQLKKVKKNERFSFLADQMRKGKCFYIGQIKTLLKKVKKNNKFEFVTFAYDYIIDKEIYETMVYEKKITKFHYVEFYKFYVRRINDRSKLIEIMNSRAQNHKINLIDSCNIQTSEDTICISKCAPEIGYNYGSYIVLNKTQIYYPSSEERDAVYLAFQRLQQLCREGVKIVPPIEGNSIIDEFNKQK